MASPLQNDSLAHVNMASTQHNYFTCTLGQAAERKTTGDKSFETIIHLIDEQARSAPNLPALGFADYSSAGHGSSVSFLELRDLSQQAAHLLAAAVGLNGTQTVGLLCTSSLDLAITWLGLMRLGISVILLA